MNITDENKIGELVALNYRTASVFKKHKIDFCCKGNRSIQRSVRRQKNRYECPHA